MRCFFASDLHGKKSRYEALFHAIAAERPQAVFLGGDLLPGGAFLASHSNNKDECFIAGYIATELGHLRDWLGAEYPRVFVILGNDDPRVIETAVQTVQNDELWEYINERWVELDSHPILGYGYVPPTPFVLKDWERYDVSRYVDPGCISPEEGQRTVSTEDYNARWATIAKDLDNLSAEIQLDQAVVLFHVPPYQTLLDRAALDGRTHDHAPLDVHIGSVAVRRFIEDRQPVLTLHGHVHESPRITGSWRDRIGITHLFTAAHDGPELALVRFDLDALEQASRELI